MAKVTSLDDYRRDKTPGICRHRRAHLDRGEVCKITYTHGDTWTHRPPLDKIRPK